MLDGAGAADSGGGDDTTAAAAAVAAAAAAAGGGGDDARPAFGVSAGDAPLLFQVRAPHGGLCWLAVAGGRLFFLQCCTQMPQGVTLPPPLPATHTNKQMTQDVPEKGLYFYSALAAFKTRTAYANTDGDHLGKGHQWRSGVLGLVVCASVTGALE